MKKRSFISRSGMKKQSVLFYLLSLPNIWLMTHLFLRGYALLDQIREKSGFQLLSDAGVLSEFKWYRDRFYTGYLLIFVLIIIMKLVSDKRGIYSPGEKHVPLQQNSVIPILIQQLILTTFAFAIAALLLDVVVLVR